MQSPIAFSPVPLQHYLTPPKKMFKKVTMYILATLRETNQSTCIPEGIKQDWSWGLRYRYYNYKGALDWTTSTRLSTSTTFQF